MNKFLFILILVFPFSSLASEEVDILVDGNETEEIIVNLTSGSKQNKIIELENKTSASKQIFLEVIGDGEKSLVSDTKFFSDELSGEYKEIVKINNYNIAAFCDKELTDEKIEQWCKGQKEASLEIGPGKSNRIFVVFDIQDDEVDHGATLRVSDGDDVLKEIDVSYVVPDKNNVQLFLTKFSLNRESGIIDIKNWFKNGLRDEYNSKMEVENSGTENTNYKYCTIIESLWIEEKNINCNESVLDALQKKEYLEKVTLPRFGKIKAFGNIRYIDENNDIIEKVTESVEITIIPFKLFVLLAVIICCGVCCVLLYKYKYKFKNMFGKNKKKKNIFTGEYTVKDADNLISIAQAFDVSWKDLAKVNELEPPYVLISGEVISVPGDAESEEEIKNVKHVNEGKSAQSVNQGMMNTSQQANVKTAANMTVPSNKPKQQTQALNQKPNNDIQKQSEIQHVQQAQQTQQTQKAQQETMPQKRKITYASPQNMVTKPSAEPTTSAIDIEWMRDDENLYAEEMEAQEKKANTKFIVLTLVTILIAGAGIFFGVTWFLENQEEDISVDNLIENQEDDINQEDVNEHNEELENQDESVNETADIDTITEQNVDEDDKSEVEENDEIAVAKEDIKIQVLNAGAATGQAGTLTKIFKDEGYSTSNAQNSQNDYDGVTIYYSKDIENSLDEITSLIPEEYGTQKKEDSDDVTKKYNADFVIVLGS